MARDESGSSALELTVLVPVLVLFAMLSIGLGRYEMARQEVAGAARAAAEAASIAPSAIDVEALASSAAGPSLARGGRSCLEANVTTDTSDFAPGGAVRVTVSCRVTFADLFVPFWPGDETVSVTESSPIDPYRSVS